MILEMKKNIKFMCAMASILALKLFLSVYGITWGLPYRWNQDERITTALRMIAEKAFFYCPVDYYHPLFYKYFLIAALAPYYLFLKLVGCNFSVIQKASSVSWLSLVKAAPDFASGIMLVGRASSVILGLFTVVMVYLIAKKMYGRKIGIFSALALTLNMGFITTNHFIKDENLAVALLVCALYLWITALDGRLNIKRIYLASFLTGLAIATKLDTTVLLSGAVLMGAYVLLSGDLSFSKKRKILFFTGLLIFAGFLFGYPRLVIPVKLKIGAVEGGVAAFSVLFAPPTIANIFLQVKMTLLNIISSFGVPVSIFVISGLAFSVYNFRKMTRAELLLYSVLIPYIFTEFFLYVAVATKLIILSLPILSIFAGYGFVKLWDKMKHFNTVRILIAGLIAAYSVFYAIKADLVFTKNDTRYISTDWIKNNIKAGSTIDILQEPEVLFSSVLIGEYKIYYQGEEIRYDNNPYREVRTGAGNAAGDYILGKGHEYVIVSSWDYMRYERGAKDHFYEKMRDNKNYSLVKKIEYDENLFFNPRPAFTSPVIFIFKETGGK